MKNLFDSEPVVVLDAVKAIIALLVAFGLNLSGEQVGAVLAAVTIILSLVARSQVTPTKS